MIRRGIKQSLAFTTAILMILSERVLHFATMMMSETSSLFASALAVFSLGMLNSEKLFYKDKWFYVAIISVAFNYHIRTQGVTLFGAVIVFFLFSKKWKEAVAFIVGFIVCGLPYMIRNKVQGLGSSRYLDTIAMSNPWRPEEGTLSFGECISRFFDTLGMLISKALPNSVIPFINLDYNQPASFGLWITGVVMIILIVAGFCLLGKYKWLLISYCIFTFGIISIFSTPSGNRYITSVLPVFTLGLVLGIYFVIDLTLKRLKINKEFSPYFLLILGLFAMTPLKNLRAANQTKFPVNYESYFKMGEEIRRQLPKNTKVACRKPSLL